MRHVSGTVVLFLALAAATTGINTTPSAAQPQATLSAFVQPTFRSLTVDSHASGAHRRLCHARIPSMTPSRTRGLQLRMASTRGRPKIDQRDLDALAALACDLKTDDGFQVAQFTRRSRPTWATEFTTILSSRILGRISQRLTWTMAWACYVTALITAGDYIAPQDWGSFTQFTVPGWPHELVGGFLSILLVFRTDQAYDRFWEGRGLWAALCSECRAVERLLLTMPPPIADRFLAYLALFPVSLKQHLRGEKNFAELRALYRIYQPTDSSGLDAILRSKNIPMTILFTLSHLAAPLRNSGRSNAALDVMWEELETRLGRLTSAAQVVSECEKIKCTPLPLSYSRHTSRFFSLYTLSLPFALVKETSPLLVPTIVVVTSWVLFATEEIGRIIEDPFSPGRSPPTAVQCEIKYKKPQS